VLAVTGEEFLRAVRESLAESTRETFDRRVTEQAAATIDDYERGLLDNPGFATGMELEAYVADSRARPRDVPESVFDVEGCDGELGLHNLEVHTPPDTAGEGLDRQARTLERRVAAVRDRLADTDYRLALDGMWAAPPPEGTRSYLGATTEHDGIVVADNMKASPRYAALDNEVLRRAGGSVPIALPGYRGAFPTILVESLATSIQPHVQIPDAETFPTYFDLALRTTGPVLALATNSPFLPADCYEGLADDSGDVSGHDAVGEQPGATGLDAEALATADAASPVAAADPEPIRDPRALVEATYHELRVPIFEQSINAGLDRADRKVRFPRDLEATPDVLDRLVEDETYAPFLSEAAEESAAEVAYDERYPELAHKRGTYWRWVRAVVGGDVPRDSGGDEASIRIEYRPLPTQPTVADVVGLQMLVAGLLKGLVAVDHPLADLPHAAARECFYDVVRDGLDAELAWITADGERTSDLDAVYADLFEHARLGLETFGVGDDRIGDLLGPLEARWRARTAPSDWRKERVLAHLDAGEEFPAAVEAAQREYLDRAAETESFADWL
jgi:hypothetical protein